MDLNYAFTDGESQPCAADTLRALDSVEFVEDAGKVFGRDANPTVRDLEARRTVRVRSGNAPAFRGRENEIGL